MIITYFDQEGEVARMEPIQLAASLADVTVFLDMDGVIANWDAGMMEYHGLEPKPGPRKWDAAAEYGMDPAEFYRPMGNPDFWAGLLPTAEKDGIVAQLEEHFEPEQIYILTSTGGKHAASAVAGKTAWLDVHMPGYGARLIPVPDAEVKTLLAGPRRILIDDNEPTIEGFRAAGGIGILVPRPWNSGHEVDHLADYFVETHLELVVSMLGKGL